MMRKKGKGRGDSGKKAVELAATAGAVAATGGGTVAVGAAVVPAFAVWGADLLGKAMGSIANRRFRKWLECVGDAMNRGSVEEVQREIETNVHKTWMRDALLESFRHLMEALDEAVLPALARLSAQYFGREEGPDIFFRSVGALLVELDSQHLAALSHLASTLIAEPKMKECVRLEIRRERHKRQLLMVQGFRPNDEEYTVEFVMDDRYPEQLPRLFSLMKRFQLGGDNPAGFYGVESGPQVLRLETVVLTRLSEILTEPVGVLNDRTRWTSPS